MYPDLYHSAHLQQRFDRALQACNSVPKNSNQNIVAIYDNNMHEKELYEAKLLSDIEKALLENQFNVVFQPKYAIGGDEPKLCSAEALVRWKHPDLLEFLQKILADNGLDTNDMHLEITETAYTDSVTSIVDVVNSLRDAGFKVEMDDFGKGYSSLNMLTSLPIDALKLDMGFIKGIAEDNKEISMVEFIVNVARFLDVPLIAEGVENSEQYLLLKKAGCDVIQGYYFSKPVSSSEFWHLIERSGK